MLSEIPVDQVIDRRRRALLVSLPQPGRVTYVASSRRNVRGAEVIFSQFQASVADHHGAASAFDVSALEAYFRARQSYEARDFAGLTKAAMDTLRDGRQTFQDRHYEVLYADWRRRGHAVLDAARLTNGRGADVPSWTFEAWCSEQSYDLFGTVWVAS